MRGHEIQQCEQTLLRPTIRAERKSATQANWVTRQASVCQSDRSTADCELAGAQSNSNSNSNSTSKSKSRISNLKSQISNLKSQIPNLERKITGAQM